MMIKDSFIIESICWEIIMGNFEINVFIIRSLLEALDEERGKFTRSDRDLMQCYIDELVLRGAYPKTTPFIEAGNTHLTLVEGWGVYWNLFNGLLECPHCKTDLRSPSGPPFKREVYVKDLRGDTPFYLECPDCSKKIAE
jgi:hypothetical protein